MFLKVEGTRAGAINGESQDSNHKDEIDVLSWSWGMDSHTGMHTDSATRRANMKELRVVKGVDKASTALMGALNSNELIKQAVLTVRKAGKQPLEYLKITIQKGRLTGYEVSPDPLDPATLREEIKFSFQAISIDYTPQGPDGQARGATNFRTDWSPTA
jgi:type VI secretion system secreted protein Hcp